MQADDRTHRSEPIRITELVDTDGVLDGHEFYDCEIKGPAVLYLSGDITLRGNNMNAPDKASLFWEIFPNRSHVLGAILANNCTFEGCTFHNIGLTGHPETLQKLREEL